MYPFLKRGEINERVLAGGLREFAAELRMVDIVDFIAYVRAEQLTHIDQLVSSAAEVALRPGVLKFASSARADLDWDSWPRISLDLEFAHQDVKVHFTLTLGGHAASVQINYMTLENIRGSGAGEQATRRLIEAVESARDYPRESAAVPSYCGPLN